MIVPGIDAALAAGCRLHAFRSGGGLRVLRLELDGKLKGYGEHPNVEDALTHVSEDYLAGGRVYNEVYGGTHCHYMTGSSSPSTDLDAWILRGRTFDAWQEGDEIVFELRGMEDSKTPEGLLQKVQDQGSFTWTSERDVTYRAILIKFPNGEPGTSIEVVSGPSGLDAWMWHAVRTGRDPDFFGAMAKAFEAKPVEVERAA